VGFAWGALDDHGRTVAWRVAKEILSRALRRFGETAGIVGNGAWRCASCRWMRERDVFLRQVSLVQLSEFRDSRAVLDPLSIFAVNLRRLREERGLSQERLGEAANVHMTHVSKIERGQCEPGVRRRAVPGDR
jgi:DNA-binding XRE family transcriptional regulator